MVTVGIEPTTVALLAQRSNQLSYATSLTFFFNPPTNLPGQSNKIEVEEKRINYRL